MRLEIPLRTRSAPNLREHWATRARRVRRERLATALACRRALRIGGLLPCVVTLTRIAPRALDEHDNLRAALKGVVDQLALELCVRDDRDPRVTWRYAQSRGGVRDYMVRVEIESGGGA